MAGAKQYADRVNIIKMVKVNGKRPFARIVECNGRIIRDHVWVDGDECRKHSICVEATIAQDFRA
jgi:integrase/recombinase XerD